MDAEFMSRRVSGPRTCGASWFAAALLVILYGLQARAELPSDLGNGPRSATLAQPASKHWVWVNDFVFPHMADGMAYLVDGDTGRYLGTLSTGYGYDRVILSRDGRLIYSPETYFSRGTRGKRTDIVTLYDTSTLEPVGEIPIPPKRASNLPMMANAVVTDDDRFLLIYNFNPAQSVTVVDTTSRKFVGEIETAGCALVYPTGNRSFFSVCGDGSLLLAELDERGAARVERSQPLFDMTGDPVTEKPVRLGGIWYFVSFAGRIYPVTADAKHASVGAPWWLTSEAERQGGWRPGGLQQLAVNLGQSTLYAIMHQGPVATHKDPGKDVWVYDVATGRRVHQFTLKSPAGSIQITVDPKPLLFAIFTDSSDLDVYDAGTGAHLRTVDHIGTSPTLLVTP